MTKKIQKVIDKVRPYIQMHGGDVTFVSFENGIVVVRITGACTHCPLADLTYNKMLGGLLQDEIPEIRQVVIEK